MKSLHKIVYLMEEICLFFMLGCDGEEGMAARMMKTFLDCKQVCGVSMRSNNKGACRLGLTARFISLRFSVLSAFCIGHLNFLMAVCL